MVVVLNRRPDLLFKNSAPEFDDLLKFIEYHHKALALGLSLDPGDWLGMVP